MYAHYPHSGGSIGEDGGPGRGLGKVDRLPITTVNSFTAANKIPTLLPNGPSPIREGRSNIVKGSHKGEGRRKLTNQTAAAALGGHIPTIHWASDGQSGTTDCM